MYLLQMKYSFASKELFQKIKTDTTSYKVVILVIASISESYNLFVECWKEYMNLFPEVKAYFLYSDPTIESDVMVYDNLILYKSNETLVPGIFQKTINAFNFCQKYLKYEYLIRTNLSTFIHIPRLLNYLSDKPKTQFIAGHYNQIPDVDNQILKQTLINTYLQKIVNDRFIYMHGTGIILSSDVVGSILNEMKTNYTKIQTVFSLPDDVLLSLIMYNFLTFEDDKENSLYYHPKEFINTYNLKVECSALIHPRFFDDGDIFLVRNKILTGVNNTDIETRYNDLMNYINQIRYFYEKPSFMDYIDEPPKKKVVDCFIFYNELDILEYRLNILNDTVDHFVLVESTKTFMGNEKPLFYADNKDRFSKFNDKITHIIVDDLIEPNVEEGEQWNNENRQRNHIDIGIGKLGLSDYDYILISDVDEIPDPKTISEHKNSTSIISFANLKQDFYYYNLCSTNSEIWLFPKIITYQEYMRQGSMPSKIRISMAPATIEKGGWHLSYFGDASFIKDKIINFSHQEFNKEEIIDEKNIEDKIKTGKDLFNRNGVTIKKISIKYNNYLPTRYNEFLSKFIDYDLTFNESDESEPIFYELSEFDVVDKIPEPQIGQEEGTLVPPQL